MSLARLVVTAVRIEGRTKAEVSRDYGVSPRWVYELCRRFDAEGEAGLDPRSRRPCGSPQQTPVQVEEEIVELRKALADEGLDGGAHTIAYDLSKRHGSAGSVATIWRVLSRRGFVSIESRGPSSVQLSSRRR
jgi:transposase